MSKNQSRKKDNSIKTAVIIFAAFIVVVGTLLVINNRSLSYAGTVNGTRIPVEHLRFQFNQNMEIMMQEMFQFGLQALDAESEAWAWENAFYALLDLNVVVAQADALGVRLSSDDIAEARAEADVIRANMTFDGIDQISQMGFSRSSFYRFIETIFLYTNISRHVGENFGTPLTAEELAEAYAVFMEGNMDDFMTPFLYMLEVESVELAEQLHNMVIMGTPIEEIIAANSVLTVHDEVVTGAVSIFDTNATWAILEMALASPEGTLSDVVEMFNGNHGFFMTSHTEIDIPEGHEENWKADRAAQHNHGIFREWVDYQLNASTYTRNSRVMGEPAPATPELEIDWDDVEFDFGDMDIDIDFGD